MISDVALGKICAQIAAMIAKAEIYVNGEWKRIRTPLTKNASAGVVSVIAQIGEEQEAGTTVTKIRLLDLNAEVFCEKAVEITRAESSSGYAYQYTLQVTASEEATMYGLR